MSSDLYFYDNNSFYHHSSPSDNGNDLFFTDPFSPFCDSSTDQILQDFSNNSQDPLQTSHSFDNFDLNFLSSSPPSHQLENLSLYQTTTAETTEPEATEPSQPLENIYSCLGIKTEECQIGFDKTEHQYFLPHSYTSGIENVTKIMQRSFSSNSFESGCKKPGADFLFQPRFDTLLESSSSLSPNYHHNKAFSPPDSTFLSSHMRRVCSTGDLQSSRSATSGTQRSYSNPLATESSYIEEGNFKVGKYSAEERKDRISKYRAKRHQRNFTKTIKYACRKTLADNRPRIRGRFARNDETSEIPKAACPNTHEDEDELWIEGVHGEEENGRIRSGGDFVNNYVQPRFQYYGY